MEEERAVTDDPVAAGGKFAPSMENPNRGNRRVGLVLEQPEPREVRYGIVRCGDVFATKVLADARTRPTADIDDIRRLIPDVAYLCKRYTDPEETIEALCTVAGHSAPGPARLAVKSLPVSD